jgi:hypothetical protein
MAESTKKMAARNKFIEGEKRRNQANCSTTLKKAPVGLLRQSRRG